HDVPRIDAGVLEDIELLERRFPGNSRVREDRNVCSDMRATYSPEHFALVFRNLVPRSDLAECGSDRGTRFRKTSAKCSEISSHDPISPNAPTTSSSTCLMSALRI